ncbi:EAL domain-containing protein [Maricurvus nonylphenolicus]|uniref:GGDEF domain-containing phosphodiesterase n=1 Tax=Maricurvus nonylphenolicus TaxID=1008307 RepID=UPI0036F35EEA
MVGDVQLDSTLWQHLIELSGAAVVLTDIDGTIQFVNQRFTDVTGYIADEVIGKTPGLLNSGRTPAALHKQLWRRIEEGKVWRGRILNRKKNGDLYWSMQSIAPINNSLGQPTRYLSVSDNITDVMGGEPDQYGFYDSETGVGNQQLLNLDLTAETGCKNYSPCELVLIEFSNKVGGKEIAEALAERLINLVGSAGSVYRLTQRRFAVLISQSARAIREFSLISPQVLTEPVALAFDQLKPRLFIGTAHGLSGHLDVKDFYRRAEVSLEQAKSRTALGNLFPKAECEIDDDELFEHLKRGLEEDALHLAAQPILDHGTQRIAALEFLLRWFHPQLGCISPVKIISIAEKNGYLYKLAIYVVNKLLRSLPADILADSSVSLSINFNLPQITNRQLINDVLQLIDESGLERSRFIFEVTETEALPVAVEDASYIFQWVRDQGVILALDDFGAGYSTLDYLSQFQVDIVKLDRQLLLDIQHSPRRRMIFKAMLQLCQSLGATVVVEGIESAEQMDFIQLLNVDNLLLQGYYFSRPHDLIGDVTDVMEVLNAQQSASL